jgi:hypothetical protein
VQDLTRRLILSLTLRHISGLFLNHVPWCSDIIPRQVTTDSAINTRTQITFTKVYLLSSPALLLFTKNFTMTLAPSVDLFAEMHDRPSASQKLTADFFVNPANKSRIVVSTSVVDGPSAGRHGLPTTPKPDSGRAYHPIST